jgi:hypothetical protein
VKKPAVQIADPVPGPRAAVSDRPNLPYDLSHTSRASRQWRKQLSAETHILSVDATPALVALARYARMAEPKALLKQGCLDDTELLPVGLSGPRDIENLCVAFFRHILKTRVDI